MIFGYVATFTLTKTYSLFKMENFYIFLVFYYVPKMGTLVTIATWNHIYAVECANTKLTNC